MVFNLVINKSNALPNNNSTYKYGFISGGLTLEGEENDEGNSAEMCISTASIPYSWYSINNTTYNNNQLSYIWGGTNKTITALGYVINNTTLNIVYFTGTALAVNDAI
jgi:hypothetical protein